MIINPAICAVTNCINAILLTLAVNGVVYIDNTRRGSDLSSYLG